VLGIQDNELTYLPNNIARLAALEEITYKPNPFADPQMNQDFEDMGKFMRFLRHQKVPPVMNLNFLALSKQLTFL
jgi:hypothetical protein